MKKQLLTYSLLAIVLISFGQDERKYIRAGNKLYDKGMYPQSEILYMKALDEQQNNEAGNFNLGNSIYRQERFDQAAQQFEITAETATEPLVRANAYHNLGNAHLKNEEYQKSVDAYIKALKIDPTDADTKYNLAYARLKLKEQQEQQKDQEQNEDQEKEEEQEEKEDQQEQENQENEDEQNKGDKDEKDQQEKNQNKDDQQQDQKDKEKSGEEDKQASQQQKPGQMSPQEAERLLQQLANKEQQVQEKMQQQQFKAVKVKIEKDW